jgi:hypothetical protein
MTLAAMRQLTERGQVMVMAMLQKMVLLQMMKQLTVRQQQQQRMVSSRNSSSKRRMWGMLLLLGVRKSSRMQLQRGWQQRWKQVGMTRDMRQKVTRMQDFEKAAL